MSSAICRNYRSQLRQLLFEKLEVRYPLTTSEYESVLSQAVSIEPQSFSANPSSASQITRNVPVTTAAGVQQMPSIAINPRDANHVVIALYGLLACPDRIRWNRGSGLS